MGLHRQQVDQVAGEWLTWEAKRRVDRALKRTVERYALHSRTHEEANGNVEFLAQAIVGQSRYAIVRWRTDGPEEALTPRENEVARLASAGFTNKEIAGRLGVSPYTIAAHMRHIFSKLRIGNRAAIGIHMVSSDR